VTKRPEDLGLSIAESKTLMATIQRQVADAQVASWVERHRCCEACGTRQRSKGSDPINFMTLYGDVRLCSLRLHHYQCQSIEGLNTVSPLRSLIPDHVAPERLYLEARWASLAPCAAAAGLALSPPAAASSPEPRLTPTATSLSPLSSGASRTSLQCCAGL
jgi:hypothetical protein